MRKHRKINSNVIYDFRILFDRDFKDEKGENPSNSELKTDIYRDHVRFIVQSKSYQAISISGLSSV